MNIASYVWTPADMVIATPDEIDARKRALDAELGFEDNGVTFAALPAGALKSPIILQALGVPVDFAGLTTALDEAEARIIRALAPLQVKQRNRIVRAARAIVQRGDTDAVAAFAIEGDEEAAAILAELVALYERGGESVMEEIEAQGPKPSAVDRVAKAAALAFLGALAAEAARSLVDRMRTAWGTAVLGQMRTGYNAAALDAAVTAPGERLLADVARRGSSTALGMGRMDAVGANADKVGREVWSAAMDENTCAPCAALDGEEFAVGEGPAAPYAGCEGGARCRCIRVPIAVSERAGAELSAMRPFPVCDTCGEAITFRGKPCGGSYIASGKTCKAGAGRAGPAKEGPAKKSTSDGGDFGSPVVSRAKLGGGISAADVVTLADGRKVVAKKDPGTVDAAEKDLKKFLAGKSETFNVPQHGGVAASRIDDALGLGVTPKTARLSDKEVGQEWIDGLDTVASGKEPDFYSKALSDPDSGIVEVAILDQIMGNADRHSGNVGYTSVGGKIRVRAIDNDLPSEYAAAVGVFTGRTDVHMAVHGAVKRGDPPGIRERVGKRIASLPDIDRDSWTRMVSNGTPEGEALARRTFVRYTSIKQRGEIDIYPLPEKRRR